MRIKKQATVSGLSITTNVQLDVVVYRLHVYVIKRLVSLQNYERPNCIRIICFNVLLPIEKAFITIKTF